MTAGVRALAVAGAVTLGVVCACGRKGPPLAPLRPVPGTVTDLAATRAGSRVTLTFTVPKANRDGSTPAAIQHIEIYVLEAPAGGAPPTPAAVLAADHLLTSVDVRPADAVRGPDDPPDRRPGAGDRAQFVDMLTQPAVDTPGAPTRHYVAVGVVGRRRGDVSVVVSVPLARVPDALRTARAGDTLPPHAASLSPPS